MIETITKIVIELQNQGLRLSQITLPVGLHRRLSFELIGEAGFITMFLGIPIESTQMEFMRLDFAP